MGRKIRIALAAAMATVGTMGMAAPAFAALDLVSSCSVSGLDDIIPNAQACSGYYDKNQLQSGAGGSASADEIAALGLIGLTGTINVIEKLDNSGNFSTLLNGLTYIGIHYGAGQGPIPGNPGGVTAFYRFDAGTNLDSLSFTNGSVSGVSLYKTGGGVPEPATWGLMILGIGLAGGAMRRRQRQAVRYAFA
ncbi:PEPxxWA-CTERM sorting domain-containing protein [Novosphingobium sp. G106]|nr:PEPxxWA-CTERM sorting domain-containing protein [Novosphingobium sp. G106]MBV1688356.1 PEPxxWA-CTERM sorting domain-containing protein [Novosphingobium sp. G106]